MKPLGNRSLPNVTSKIGHFDIDHIKNGQLANMNQFEMVHFEIWSLRNRSLKK